MVFTLRRLGGSKRTCFVKFHRCWGRCISSGRFPPSSLMVTRKLFECPYLHRSPADARCGAKCSKSCSWMRDAFGHLLGKYSIGIHKIIDIYWVFQFLPQKSQAHFNGFLIFDLSGAILCHSGERFSRTRKQGGRSLTATTWHDLIRPDTSWQMRNT